jgi:hypothetical protein
VGLFCFGFLAGFALGGFVGWHLAYDKATERTNDGWWAQERKPPRNFQKFGDDE